jgi:hypothetical protein
VIYKVHDTQYMFERHGQKLIIFAFLGRFHELLPIVLGFRGDLQGIWQSIHFREECQKYVIFAFMAVFVSYCP